MTARERMTDQTPELNRVHHMDALTLLRALSVGVHYKTQEEW